MDADLDRLRATVERRLHLTGGVIVAFSGGVDSSLVAALAARALGADALAVTAVSPALATGELHGARSVAQAVGIAHEIISTNELARRGYRLNGVDRCYHCKSELYDALAQLARERGFAVVASGANSDDLGDWRPGLRAASEHGVIHPLVEAGVTKAQVRAMARALAIPSATKPASPCLASRIPYGTAVDETTLERIDRAEQAVHALGFAELRVRHYGDLGRLEVAAADLARALEPPTHARLCAAIRAAGYARVVVARQPLRSGSLNVVAPQPPPAPPRARAPRPLSRATPRVARPVRSPRAPARG